MDDPNKQTRLHFATFIATEVLCCTKRLGCVMWAVVLARLVDRSLPTLEIRSLNPDIGKLYLYFLSTVLKRRKYIKRDRESSILKKTRMS